VSPAVANVVLIGYRGSGKTEVGRALAARLGWSFVDTDTLIEQQTGRRIREIFAADGEQTFRALEQAAIARVATGRAQVLSVGGGAALAEANRRALRACGPCVWLTAPPAELHRRLAADPQSPALRPNLTTAGGLAEIEHVLNERTPLYNSLADVTFDTTGRAVTAIAADIGTWLASWQPPADRA